MSGSPSPRLVYGDGWDDIKDCCGGGLIRKPSFGGFTGGRGGRERSCTRTQLAVGVAFLWLFIVTIVCIVLGSKISSTSNSHLSSRLEDLSSQHASRHSKHSKLLSDLTSSHRNLRGRVEGVAGDLGKLNGDVDQLEVSLRGEVRSKLLGVRTTLMDALDRVGKSIREIRADVERGMVKRRRRRSRRNVTSRWSAV